MDPMMISPEMEDAELALVRAETRKADFEAETHRLKNIIYEHEVADRLASDDHFHTYSFYSPVMGSTVEKAMYELERWRRKAPGAPITITFNSPGGVVTDGFTLYDFLRELSASGHEITTKCMGAAASMGAILMQAGDTRVMTPNSFMMVHEISGGNEGTIAEMKDTIAIVQKFQEKALNILLARANITRARLTRQWKKTDWYLDAEEALKLGFVDRIEA